MKRYALIGSAVLACLAVLAPALRADVTTRRKTQVKFEGLLGSIVNRFGGSAAKNGIESTIAIKGNRMSTISDQTGKIIDLGEEKVYDLNVKKKEYTVTTFDELRAQWQKTQAEARKQAEKAQPEEKKPEGQPEKPAKEYEFDASVKDTGQHKTLAGYDTHEVIVTITAHEKGKTLDQSGGFVMTSDLWMGPKIPALSEIVQFNLKYIKAIYGEQFVTDMQQMAQMYAMYPSFAPMSQRMQAESDKLQGTALLSTATFDSVKSPDEMKADQDQQQQPRSGGGGLGGLLSKRLTGNRSAPQQRATVMTITNETLSVQPTATDADVAIPAGYTEKTK
jgi:hypothetical protein